MLVMHLAVLGGASLLMFMVSYDTFQSLSFVSNPTYLKVQFWVCLFFLADIILGIALSRRRARSFLRHIPDILLCVPYLTVLAHFHVRLEGEWLFVVQLLPVLRAVFVLGSVLRDLDIGRLSSMFGAYLLLLLTIIYFSALMFYVVEGGCNPGIHSFRSALYWAVMSMTTTGCQITETTTIGQTIAVVLSVTGLTLFPVFTVYISNALAGNSAQS